MEDNTHTTTKNSFALVMEGGSGSIVGPGKTGEKDQGSIERTSVVRLEKKQSEKTLRDGDFPTRVGRTDAGYPMARVESFALLSVPSHNQSLTKFFEDALSLVGQKAQKEKELIEVSSPLKPTP